MLSNDSFEGMHQTLEPVFSHIAQLPVPKGSLPKERVCSVFVDTRLERLVQAGRLARGAQEREQPVRDGEEKKKAVAPGVWTSHGSRGLTHAYPTDS